MHSIIEGLRHVLLNKVRYKVSKVVILIGIFLDNETEKNIIARLRIAGCVFAEEESQLFISEARTLEDLEKMVELRVSGLPLEYIVGFTDFCGLRIEVDRGVFVPRRRTEYLVHRAVASSKPGAIVVDLCCGTGAVGAAIAKALGNIELYAVDIDPASVQCARRNVAAIGGLVLEGDLYEPLPKNLHGRVDILATNAPYVPSKLIRLLPQEARLYEPKAALDGGEDGLDIQRRVAEDALLWLAPGGHLLVETSNMQAPQTFEIFAQNGLLPQMTKCDELDAAVVIGTKPL
jgi:release factor glutamine methyltransferase